LIYLLEPIVEIQCYVIELFKSGKIGPFSTLKTLLYRSKPDFFQVKNGEIPPQHKKKTLPETVIKWSCTDDVKL